MQAFRVREFVRVGTPDVVVAWRDMWLERGLDIMNSLGLPAESRRRERSVLRSRRPDARRRPAQSRSSSSRCSSPWSRRTIPPPCARSIRTRSISATDLRHPHGGRRYRATRPASASASSAYAWRCSSTTDSIRASGRMARGRALAVMTELAAIVPIDARTYAPTSCTAPSAPGQSRTVTSTSGSRSFTRSASNPAPASLSCPPSTGKETS